MLQPSPLEEQDPGIIVATLVASDGDQADTDNSRITYSITDVSATPAPGVSISVSRMMPIIYCTC